MSMVQHGTDSFEVEQVTAADGSRQDVKTVCQLGVLKRKVIR